MLQSFIIILREGFESFLLVAVILSYLRKSGRRHLVSATYWAILVAVLICGGLGYLLFQLQHGIDWRGRARTGGSSDGRLAGNLHVADRLEAQRENGRATERSFRRTNRLGGLCGSFSFHRFDHQSRRNGNRVDALAGSHAANSL